MTPLTDQAYQKAQEALLRCVSAIGFTASGTQEGYPHVWARDSAITAMGALLTTEKRFSWAARKSLETLRAYQTELGYIPLNVHSATKKVESMLAGGVDSNSWYIISHLVYFEATGDKAFLRESYPSLGAALRWLRFQDQNNDGLLEMQEAADWEDILAVRGAGLTINVLYAQALSCFGKMARALSKNTEAQRLEQEGKKMRDRINQRFWIDADDTLQKPPRALTAEWQVAQSQAVARLRNTPYYLPFLAFRDFGTWCDALGNLLVILFDVANERRSREILRYMHEKGMDDPYPVKAIYPPIFPGEKDWREYYLAHNLNLPHQYHNGGIWPFIGGLYVAALVKTNQIKRAQQALERIARANQLGRTQEWEFNEWLHGENGRPNGMPYQAWSAAMYIFAHESVKQRRAPFFP